VIKIIELNASTDSPNSIFREGQNIFKSTMESAATIGISKQSDPLMDTLMTIFNFYIPCVMISLGIIGNTLTIITMTRSIKQRRNVVMSYHFRALAVGDNAMLLFVLYQRIILSRFPNAFDLYGNFLCKEFFYLLFLCFGVSVCNVVIISIDRFVAVCFPLKAASWCTVGKARACYLSNFTFYALFNLIKLWKEYRTDDTNVHTATCVNPRNFPPWFEKFILTFYESIINYAAPLIVLVLNVSILVKFKRRGKELQAMGEKGQTKKHEIIERSLTVMMMVVAFTFIVIMAYYPLEAMVWEFLIPGIRKKFPRVRELSFYVAFYFTGGLNQCLNFYIYLLVNASFRSDVRRLLHLS
jgi:hypothetical protein